MEKEEMALTAPGGVLVKKRANEKNREKRKNWKSTLLMVLGAAMMAVALLLFLHTPLRDWRLGRSAAETVEVIKGQTGGAAVSGMAAVEYSGYAYMGCLTIPELELELPVMADWSDEKLKVSPCRYYGSLASEDMVLMAHNYAPFFGHLKKLSVGDALSFTDVNGQIWAYTVAELEVLPPDAVQEMTHSGYPLTLFTCTDDNANRLTVRCTAANQMR